MPTLTTTSHLQVDLTETNTEEDDKTSEVYSSDSEEEEEEIYLKDVGFRTLLSAHAIEEATMASEPVSAMASNRECNKAQGKPTAKKRKKEPSVFNCTWYKDKNGVTRRRKKKNWKVAARKSMKNFLYSGGATTRVTMVVPKK